MEKYKGRYLTLQSRMPIFDFKMYIPLFLRIRYNNYSTNVLRVFYTGIFFAWKLKRHANYSLKQIFFFFSEAFKMK